MALERLRLPTVVGALVFVALSSISLFSSLVESLIVASWGGASSKIDAFLSGKALPDVIISLLSTATYAAVLPVIINIREQEGEKGFWNISRFVTLVVTTVALLISTILIVAAPFLIHLLFPGISEYERSIAVRTMQLMFLAVPLTATLLVFRSIFESNNLFWPSTVPGIARSVLVVVFILLAGKILDVYSIVFGIIASQVLGIMLSIYVLTTRLSDFRGQWWQPQYLSALRKVGWSILPITISLSIYYVLNLFDRILASELETGVITHLHLAYVLIGVPHSIIGVSLSTLIFPALSQAMATKNDDLIRRLLSRACRLVVALSIPIALLLFIEADSVVYLVFERGKFTAQDTESVCELLRVYALIFPVYGSISVIARTLVSIQQHRALLQISVGAVLLKLVIGYFLMQWLGGPGIALSTNFVLVFFMVWGASAIRRQLNFLFEKEDYRSLATSLIAIAPTAIIAFLLRENFFLASGDSVPITFLRLALIGLVLFATYITALGILHSAELQFVWSNLTRTLNCRQGNSQT